MPRPLLQQAGLNARDCMVLTRCNYCREKRRPLRLRELAVIFDCSKGTISKSLTRLRKVGWIDHRNFVVRSMPSPEPGKKNSFVEISGERLRMLGPNDALVAAQLETMHTNPDARTEDFRTLALPGMVAKYIGTKRAPGRRAKRGRDGVRHGIRRLANGDPLQHRVRVRRYARTHEGEAPVSAPFIKLEQTHTNALTFRFLLDREREKLRATTRPASQPTTTKATTPERLAKACADVEGADLSNAPTAPKRAPKLGEQLELAERAALKDGLAHVEALVKRHRAERAKAAVEGTGPPDTPAVHGLPYFLPGTNNAL